MRNPHTHLIAAVACAATFMAFLPPVAAAQGKQAAQKKTIDLVLCLDTSNSMDGLIGSAKARLWDIVNELAKAKPTPTLRVALYSFGNDGYNRGNGWIRKDLGFTSDLDMVNEKLFALRTRGGTEYATRVARDAMDQLKWTADPGTLKLIFVCGNEPANQDRQTPIKTIAERAARQGIIINTIYCGNATDGAARSWEQFSRLAEGRFASINQSSGVKVVATPFDKDLAGIGGKLNSTFLFYGEKKVRRALKDNQAKQDANAKSAGRGVAAARNATKATALYRFSNDLVQKVCDDPKFNIKKVPVAQLPKALQKLTPAKREEHVRELLAERKQLQKRIAELSQKRDAYIREYNKKNATAGQRALDQAIRVMLREQSRAKGFQIDKR